MRKTARVEMDSQLEFYVTVEYFTNKKHPSGNVNVKNPHYSPASKTNTSAPMPAPAPKAKGSPAESKPPSKKEEAGIVETISKSWGDLVDYVETTGKAIMEQLPTFPKPTNVSANKVGTTQVEGLTDAYFAKKEFTRLTGQEDGSYEYTFGGTKASNNTSTAANKEEVANAILNAGKVNEKLKPQKKYTTKEAIIAALTATEYGRDTPNHKKVAFKTFKLGEEFKRIQSAQLEEKVYLVATTYFLDGKTASIIVKEKDGIIKGSADATLPISEISEAKMASSEPLTEADRTEKTTFSGTIAKIETVKDADGKPVTSEMYIVPVQLRPKTDADLAVWKEKLGKGVQDGTYTYTFKNGYCVIDSNKNELATAIVNNAIKGSHGNPKLDAGKTANIEDVQNVLQTKTYASGETIKFPVYKKVSEMLWLDVTASGTKDHKKEFLKGGGKYFEIGGVCECEAKIRAFMRMIRKGEGTIDEGGYTRIVGGSTFADHGKNMSTHPRVYIAAHDSTAAGAYQITKTNWDDSPFVNWRVENGINDFSTESQDIYAVYLITKKRKAFDHVINNQFEEAVEKCRLEWASLPGAGYNQREEKLETIQNLYNKFLNEELSGRQGAEAKLHIRPGFLKQYFDYDCCGDSSTEQCPDNRSQCFEYSDVVSNPRLNNQSNNVNKNRFQRAMRYNRTHPNGYYHTGTDILAPLNTDLMAMLCGEVIEAYDTGGDLGKIITIKSKDQNGRRVFIRYCHLNSIAVFQHQKVRHGSKIGKSGNTGNARTILIQHNHVHIEASTDGVFYGGNTRIDPEQFMKTKFDETNQGTPIN